MRQNWIIIGIALMLVGCRPSSPQLNYQSVSFAPISFQEVKATLQGTISNDNLFPLSGKIAYATKVSGQEMFRGESKDISVGSQQTVPFTLETTIALPQIYGSLKDLITKINQGETEIPISIEGSYSTNILGMTLSAPLKAEAKIPLPKLPKIQLTNISVQTLSLTQATLKIAAQITNNNPMPINIQKFAYQLLGNNKEIASSAFAGDMNIEPNKTQNVDWEITINLKAIDSTLVKRLLDGSLQTSLKQDIESIQ